MDEKKSIISIFFAHLASTFMAAIIAVSIAGWVGGGNVFEGAGLLRLGNQGLAFSSIAQLFAWSIVLSAFITLLTSDVILKKTMLLWRVLLLLLLGILTSVAFAVIFRWFPLGSWEAWAGFLIPFAVGFGGGLFLMVAATKAADKQYEKLLSDYKSNQNKEESK